MEANKRAWRERRIAQGLCLQCGNKTGEAQICRDCRVKSRKYINAANKRRRPAMLAWARKKSAERKAIVFAHYGERCKCCGETTSEFLTIDHVERNGSTDPRCHYPGKPKHFRVSGGRWYHLIIKLGFPKDLRLLCWNCNHAEHIYGKCPHQA